jgi:uncharacterized protein YjbI with pentapeptide repeats
VRDEELRVAAEPSPPPREAPEDRASRVPRWLVVVLAVLALVGVVGVIVYGYLARPGWIGVSGKEFWEYLELLIVPAALAIGVYYLNRAQSEREREAEEIQQQRERRAQAAQRERELEVENQHAQDVALQAYLDQMSHLLLDKDRPLRESEETDEVQTVARARTLTALSQLDGVRKSRVIRFLLEAQLITGRLLGNREERLYPIISLEDADLSHLALLGYDLSDAVMSAANLTDADLSGCGLRDAWLNGAWLGNAYLVATDLSHADLNGAYLRGASLHGAHLIGASLFLADLADADLMDAELIGADLSGEDHRCTTGEDVPGADLTNADLSRANLREAKVTQEQLDQAKSLKGATMPNSQKYEDWLKSEGRGEDEENSGPS